MCGRSNLVACDISGKKFWVTIAVLIHSQMSFGHRILPQFPSHDLRKPQNCTAIQRHEAESMMKMLTLAVFIFIQKQRILNTIRANNRDLLRDLLDASNCSD